MNYLVDTSWIVEYLRGNQPIIERMSTFRPEGLAVSVISVAELYEGVFRSRNQAGNETAVRDFLAGVTILAINDEVCRVYGEEMAMLRRKGMSMGHLDLLIAATALHHDLTLLTLDGDFQRVDGLKGLYS